MTLTHSIDASFAIEVCQTPFLLGWSETTSLLDLVLDFNTGKSAMFFAFAL